ncbi:hypothetical protein [Pseudomonas sp. DWP3-1-2]|uniref:hypothetical protein n=1 Tax=Pseudomonas sp. DWP3-1-2 TaxID=2804645 RepID=UPI003CF99C59
MLTINKFFLALAFLGGSAAAQAADGERELARVLPGKTSERMDRTESEIRHEASGVWSQGLSQQNVDPLPGSRPYYTLSYQDITGTHNGVPVARQNLSGHYDVGLTHISSTHVFDAGTITPDVSPQASLSLSGHSETWLPVHHLL